MRCAEVAGSGAPYGKLCVLRVYHDFGLGIDFEALPEVIRRGAENDRAADGTSGNDSAELAIGKLG